VKVTLPPTLITLLRMRRDTRPALVRLLIGVVLIVGIVTGPGLYGRLTASDRLAPSLQEVNGPANVRVLLAFLPQAFHESQLSPYGVFAGRHGNAVFLFNVPANRLRDLASIYWVEKVEPLKLSG
jgi:hypothetical protein